MPKILQIKLARSTIGYNQRQTDTARALGLRKLNPVVEKEDTPDIRGMVNTIAHLVEVTEKTN